MSYKVVTIPSVADSPKEVSIGGNSIIIASAQAYKDPNTVPLFKFDSVGFEENPIQEGSVYNVGKCKKFSRILIYNKGAGEGDEVALWSTDKFLNTEIKQPFQRSIPKEFKDTFTKSADDTVQDFDEIELTNTDGDLPSAVYIFVVGGATRGINYKFGSLVVGDQGANNNGAMYWDNDDSNVDYEMQPLILRGIELIKSFQFIASVAGETPNLLVTCEY